MPAPSRPRRGKRYEFTPRVEAELSRLLTRHNRSAAFGSRTSLATFRTVYRRGAEEYSRAPAPAGMSRHAFALRRVREFSNSLALRTARTASAASTQLPPRDADLFPAYTPPGRLARTIDSALAQGADEVLRHLVAAAPLPSDTPHRVFQLTRALALVSSSPTLDVTLGPDLRALIADGNSSIARSIRARRQLRDRKGRWIEMGGGVRFKIRAPGTPGGGTWHHGTVAGIDVPNGRVDVRLENGDVVRIPNDKLEQPKAIIDLKRGDTPATPDPEDDANAPVVEEAEAEKVSAPRVNQGEPVEQREIVRGAVDSHDELLARIPTDSTARRQATDFGTRVEDALARFRSGELSPSDLRATLSDAASEADAFGRADPSLSDAEREAFRAYGEDLTDVAAGLDTPEQPLPRPDEPATPAPAASPDPGFDEIRSVHDRLRALADDAEEGSDLANNLDAMANIAGNVARQLDSGSITQQRAGALMDQVSQQTDVVLDELDVPGPVEDELTDVQAVVDGLKVRLNQNALGRTPAPAPSPVARLPETPISPDEIERMTRRGWSPGIVPTKPPASDEKMTKRQMIDEIIEKANQGGTPLSTAAQDVIARMLGKRSKTQVRKELEKARTQTPEQVRADYDPRAAPPPEITPEQMPESREQPSTPADMWTPGRIRGGPPPSEPPPAAQEPEAQGREQLLDDLTQLADDYGNARLNDGSLLYQELGSYVDDLRESDYDPEGIAADLRTIMGQLEQAMDDRIGNQENIDGEDALGHVVERLRAGEYGGPFDLLPEPETPAPAQAQGRDELLGRLQEIADDFPRAELDGGETLGEDLANYIDDLRESDFDPDGIAADLERTATSLEQALDDRRGSLDQVSAIDTLRGVAQRLRAGEYGPAFDQPVPEPESAPEFTDPAPLRGARLQFMPQERLAQLGPGESLEREVTNDPHYNPDNTDASGTPIPEGWRGIGITRGENPTSWHVDANGNTVQVSRFTPQVPTDDNPNAEPRIFYSAFTPDGSQAGENLRSWDEVAEALSPEGAAEPGPDLSLGDTPEARFVNAIRRAGIPEDKVVGALLRTNARNDEPGVYTLPDPGGEKVYLEGVTKDDLHALKDRFEQALQRGRRSRRGNANVHTRQEAERIVSENPPTAPASADDLRPAAEQAAVRLQQAHADAGHGDLQRQANIPLEIFDGLGPSGLDSLNRALGQQPDENGNVKFYSRGREITASQADLQAIEDFHKATQREWIANVEKNRGRELTPLEMSQAEKAGRLRANTRLQEKLRQTPVAPRPAPEASVPENNPPLLQRDDLFNVDWTGHPDRMPINSPGGGQHWHHNPDKFDSRGEPLPEGWSGRGLTYSGDSWHQDADGNLVRVIRRGGIFPGGVEAPMAVFPAGEQDTPFAGHPVQNWDEVAAALSPETPPRPAPEPEVIATPDLGSVDEQFDNLTADPELGNIDAGNIDDSDSAPIAETISRVGTALDAEEISEAEAADILDRLADDAEEGGASADAVGRIRELASTLSEPAARPALGPAEGPWRAQPAQPRVPTPEPDISVPSAESVPGKWDWQGVDWSQVDASDPKYAQLVQDLAESRALDFLPDSGPDADPTRRKVALAAEYISTYTELDENDDRYTPDELEGEYGFDSFFTDLHHLSRNPDQINGSDSMAAEWLKTTAAARNENVAYRGTTLSDEAFQQLRPGAEIDVTPGSWSNSPHTADGYVGELNYDDPDRYPHGVVFETPPGAHLLDLGGIGRNTPLGLIDSHLWGGDRFRVESMEQRENPVTGEPTTYVQLTPVGASDEGWSTPQTGPSRLEQLREDPELQGVDVPNFEDTDAMPASDAAGAAREMLGEEFPDLPAIARWMDGIADFVQDRNPAAAEEFRNVAREVRGEQPVSAPPPAPAPEEPLPEAVDESRPFDYQRANDLMRDAAEDLRNAGMDRQAEEIDDFIADSEDADGEMSWGMIADMLEEHRGTIAGLREGVDPDDDARRAALFAAEDSLSNARDYAVTGDGESSDTQTPADDDPERSQRLDVAQDAMNEASDQISEVREGTGDAEIDADLSAVQDRIENIWQSFDDGLLSGDEAAEALRDLDMRNAVADAISEMGASQDITRRINRSLDEAADALDGMGENVLNIAPDNPRSPSPGLVRPSLTPRQRLADMASDLSDLVEEEGYGNIGGGIQQLLDLHDDGEINRDELITGLREASDSMGNIPDDMGELDVDRRQSDLSDLIDEFERQPEPAGELNAEQRLEDMATDLSDLVDEGYGNIGQGIQRLLDLHIDAEISSSELIAGLREASDAMGDIPDDMGELEIDRRQSELSDLIDAFERQVADIPESSGAGSPVDRRPEPRIERAPNQRLADMADELSELVDEDYGNIGGGIQQLLDLADDGEITEDELITGLREASDAMGSIPDDMGELDIDRRQAALSELIDEIEDENAAAIQRGEISSPPEPTGPARAETPAPAGEADRAGNPVPLDYQQVRSIELANGERVDVYAAPDGLPPMEVWVSQATRHLQLPDGTVIAPGQGMYVVRDARTRIPVANVANWDEATAAVALHREAEQAPSTPDAVREQRRREAERQANNERRERENLDELDQPLPNGWFRQTTGEGDPVYRLRGTTYSAMPLANGDVALVHRERDGSYVTVGTYPMNEVQAGVQQDKMRLARENRQGITNWLADNGFPTDLVRQAQEEPSGRRLVDAITDSPRYGEIYEAYVDAQGADMMSPAQREAYDRYNAVAPLLETALDIQPPEAPAEAAAPTPARDFNAIRGFERGLEDIASEIEIDSPEFAAELNSFASQLGYFADSEESGRISQEEADREYANLAEALDDLSLEMDEYPILAQRVRSEMDRLRQHFTPPEGEEPAPEPAGTPDPVQDAMRMAEEIYEWADDINIEDREDEPIADRLRQIMLPLQEGGDPNEVADGLDELAEMLDTDGTFGEDMLDEANEAYDRLADLQNRVRAIAAPSAPAAPTPAAPETPAPAAPAGARPPGAAPNRRVYYDRDGVVANGVGDEIYRGVRVVGRDLKHGEVISVQENPAYARIRFDDGTVRVRSARTLAVERRSETPPPAVPAEPEPTPSPAAPRGDVRDRIAGNRAREVIIDEIIRLRDEKYPDEALDPNEARRRLLQLTPEQRAALVQELRETPTPANQPDSDELRQQRIEALRERLRGPATPEAPVARNMAVERAAADEEQRAQPTEVRDAAARGAIDMLVQDFAESTQNRDYANERSALGAVKTRLDVIRRDVEDGEDYAVVKPPGGVETMISRANAIELLDLFERAGGDEGRAFDMISQAQPQVVNTDDWFGRMQREAMEHELANPAASSVPSLPAADPEPDPVAQAERQSMEDWERELLEGDDEAAAEQARQEIAPEPNAIEAIRQLQAAIPMNMRNARANLEQRLGRRATDDQVRRFRNSSYALNDAIRAADMGDRPAAIAAAERAERLLNNVGLRDDATRVRGWANGLRAQPATPEPAAPTPEPPAPVAQRLDIDAKRALGDLREELPRRVGRARNRYALDRRQAGFAIQHALRHDRMGRLEERDAELNRARGLLERHGQREKVERLDRARGGEAGPAAAPAEPAAPAAPPPFDKVEALDRALEIENMHADGARAGFPRLDEVQAARDAISRAIVAARSDDRQGFVDNMKVAIEKYLAAEDTGIAHPRLAADVPRRRDAAQRLLAQVESPAAPEEPEGERTPPRRGIKPQFAPNDWVDVPAPNVGARDLDSVVPGVQDPNHNRVHTKAVRPNAVPADYEEWGTRGAEIAAAARNRPALANILDENVSEAEAAHMALQAFGGEGQKFGNSDFTVKVSSVSRDFPSERRRNNPDESAVTYVSIAGSIETETRPGGPKTTAGSFSRTIMYDHHTNQVTVKDNILQLTADNQRSGFGTAWKRHLENWYIANGVSKVKTDPAGDEGWTGGVAWALNGFGWAPDFNPIHMAGSALQKVIGKARNNQQAMAQVRELQARVAEARANMNDGMSAEQKQAVYDQYLPTPLEIALVGYRPDLKVWPGQQGMKDLSWNAVKRLQPGAREQIQRAGWERSKAAEDRVRNEVNKANVSRSVIEKFMNDDWKSQRNTSPTYAQVLNDNRETIVNVLQNGHSLAQIPIPVKNALRAWTNDKMSNFSETKRKYGADGASELRQLSDQLESERRFDQPDNVAIPERIRDLLGKAKQRDYENDSIPEFDVENLRAIGEGGFNTTYRVTHRPTGQVLFVKFDSLGDAAAGRVGASRDSEHDMNLLARNMGWAGMPEFAPHPGEGNASIMQRVGDSQDLEERPKNAAKFRRHSREILENLARPEQLIGMWLFDGIIGNNDRHEANFQLAKDKLSQWWIYPIDHGLAGGGAGFRAAQAWGSPRQGLQAVQRVNFLYGQLGTLRSMVGRPRFEEMIREQLEAMRKSARQGGYLDPGFVQHIEDRVEAALPDVGGIAGAVV